MIPSFPAADGSPALSLALDPVPCRAGSVIPLAFSGAITPAAPAGLLCHTAAGAPRPLPVGARITAPGGETVFQVAGRGFLPGLTFPCPLLQALEDWPYVHAAPFAAGEPWNVSLSGYALACVTMSDKGFAGERQDASGPRLAQAVAAVLPLRHVQRFVLPDEPGDLRALALELAVGQGYDLILVTGGTGLAPRDTTPEALLPVLDRRLPGFEQAMTLFSLSQTPRAALARLVAGTIGRCLILALPGSARAAGENLEAVLPTLPHALEKLHGDPADCGG